VTEYIIQPRLNTAAGAAANNRVLAMGERGYETDTGRWKTGDGATNWNDLGYDDDPEKIAGSTAEGRAVLTGDAAAGRTALGATTAAAALTDAQARIAAWAGADAYIDFTNKPDGDPPSMLDTGQAVDFVWGPSNWKPQIVGGKLAPQASLPSSGTYADYIQAQLDGDCRAFGTRFTVNTSDGATAGVMCIAVWADFYQTGGTVVPHSPAHITIDTTTGAWQWWVNGPGATYPATYLKAAKTGTFTPPASDGSAVWEVAGYIDADRGIAYLYLPGNDAVTGTRVVTVTDAEIAASMTAQSVPVTTLATCLAGADVLMVEHQANATPNTARMPRFLDMWGETLRKPRDANRVVRQAAITPPAQTVVQFAPSTQQAKAISAGTTIIYTDTGNTTAATITATAGPNGKVEFLVTGVCVEFGGSTRRVVTDGAISSGSTTLTSATAVFTVDDVNSPIVVIGAGAGGGDLHTWIASRTNATTVVLADAAGTTVASGGTVRIYTPTETILYAKMTASGPSNTTPNPDCVHRGRAGQRWTGSIALVATGLTPGGTKSWTFTMATFPFGDGTATLKFGGSSTAVYPSLKIQATPV
jgi:hypothetical protein